MTDYKELVINWDYNLKPVLQSDDGGVTFSYRKNIEKIIITL